MCVIRQSAPSTILLKQPKATFSDRKKNTATPGHSNSRYSRQLPSMDFRRPDEQTPPPPPSPPPQEKPRALSPPRESRNEDKSTPSDVFPPPPRPEGKQKGESDIPPSSRCGLLRPPPPPPPPKEPVARWERRLALGRQGLRKTIPTSSILV